MDQSLETIIENLRIYEFLFKIISNPYYIAFICILVPITIFAYIVLIHNRIRRLDKTIDDLIQNQATQIAQNERIIILLEQIKNKDYDHKDV